MSAMPSTSSASVDGIDLLDSLQQSLLNLRQCWPADWPGLALVFDRCMQRLGWPTAGAAPRLQALVNCAHEIAANIEDAARLLNEAEPAYHNRLHIADTLVSMTHLLLALRRQKCAGAGVTHLELLCLAIMVAHDFMHPGGSNAFPGQFERMAVQALEPLMRDAGLDARDQAMLAHCILQTDPVCVKSAHEATVDRPFDLADRHWMTVLVQEADILASTLPQTQESLTQALSLEWRPTNPEAAAKLLLPFSRMMFLEHAALFSSPAAQSLGLGEVKALQVEALRAHT